MLTFLGDVSLITDSISSEYKPDNQYIFNCEYVIGDQNELVPVIGKINLAGRRSDFCDIFGHEPTAVVLANNHINDYGHVGYIQTVKRLEEKNIKCSIGEPLWIGNICLLSYMDLDSANELDKNLLFNKEEAFKHIQNIKSISSAYIVVNMHWGIENNPNAIKRQVNVAHWLIDHGVDLVIGHHPHCTQRVEKYKDKFIFYSLGNALFPPINHHSHFDKTGKPTRKYRFKWQRWNRLSYAVTVNDTLDVTSVDLLYQTRTNCLKRAGNIPLEKLVQNKDKPSFVYAFRKYYLFLVSNCFVDGKLFDLKAIKAEMHK